MDIIFLANPNINRGSYRIWINDLNYFIKEYTELNVIIIDILKNSINNLGEYIKSNSVFIIDKVLICDDIILKIKNLGKKIYLINPPLQDNLVYKYVDGFIVGSIEEKDSLLKYKSKILIFPLIERQFYNSKNLKSYKLDDDNNTIIIGYHGNPNHLNHLNISCKNAINRLIKKNKEYNFRLLVITNNINQWIIGKPNIPIDYIKYNLETIEKDLLKIDIGIVPNISGYSNTQKINKQDNMLGKYDSDIKIRFKNKSNNGRALVFHQLKIPIIADYTPSNIHILGDPKNGYAVCSEDGWYNAFNELLDIKKREYISNNAYLEVKNKYNPKIWVDELINNL
jgi:hypothetical protein